MTDDKTIQSVPLTGEDVDAIRQALSAAAVAWENEVGHGMPTPYWRRLHGLLLAYASPSYKRRANIIDH